MDKRRIKDAAPWAIVLGIWTTGGTVFFDVIREHHPLYFDQIIFTFLLNTVLGFFFIDNRLLALSKRREANKELRVPKEFRCFKCENIIHVGEKECLKCGWTWDTR